MNFDIIELLSLRDLMKKQVDYYKNEFEKYDDENYKIICESKYKTYLNLYFKFDNELKKLGF